MTQPGTLADQQQRERIRADLDACLFVEAGAGTGKTTALVARIVEMVSSGRGEMAGLAAITFTEAAAAELRQRVRQGLEQAAEDAVLDEDAQNRCRQAVAEIDAASIQTLHSFALSILRDAPIEAGLPPGFETLDQIEADLRFEHAWAAWVDEALEDRELGPALAHALHLGLEMRALRDVAEALRNDYDLVSRQAFPQAPEPAAMTIAEMVQETVPAIRLLMTYSMNGHGDKLYDKCQEVIDIARRMPQPGGAPKPYERALVRILSQQRLTTNRGRQGDWGKIADGEEVLLDEEEGDVLAGMNACKALKNFVLGPLDDERREQIERVRATAFWPILEEVRRFVVAQAERRRAAGEAEFLDLLVWARDLLRDDPAVRRRFQRRFHHILVDEFQDTDPIQAEIAFFLAGDPDAASGAATRWEDVTPAPGKLFMVGDPKQSIYRFRRADITTMEGVRASPALETVHLQQNFRSQGSIIAWVNTLFGACGWMGAVNGFLPDRDAMEEEEDGEEEDGDGGDAFDAVFDDEEFEDEDEEEEEEEEEQPGVYLPLQPAYTPLIATPELTDTGEAPSPAVYLLGEGLVAGVQDVRQLEAASVAALARAVRATPWRVRDLATRAWRDAAYQDICVLLPARTGMPALEEALTRQDVPYRIESESIVLQTEDVRQLLNCLRAIDSPGDQVALVAALRSAAFACSDVELLQFVDGGGRFDYHNPGPPGGAVAEAMEALRKWSQQAVWSPPDALIEGFIRERRLVELSFGRRRVRERWRRLRLVVEQARAYMRAGGSSLRGFVDWIEGQIEGGGRAVESPTPEADEDCVRIMTVHAAKGLEFPITVVVGLGATSRNRPGNVIVDRYSGHAEVQLNSGHTRLISTGGYEAAHKLESQALEMERIRLAYVAFTRARDHLVVSGFHQLPAKQENAGQQSLARDIQGLLSADPHVWQKLDWKGLAAMEPPESVATSIVAPDAAQFAAERSAWQALRDAVLERASARQAEAVTALAQRAKAGAPAEADRRPAGADDEPVTAVKEEGGDGETPYRRGRAATNLGRAVHATLQSVDLLTGEGIEDIARSQAEAEGVGDRADEVARLTQAALRSDTLRRLAAAVSAGTATYYREIFVSTPLAGKLVEGYIDLLIDGPDGLVVVDYKTDRLTERQVAELGPEYQVQLGLYAWAIEQTTGRPVERATLLFLRPDQELSFTNMAELKAQALESATVAE